MAVCGWCKRKGLKQYRASTVDKATDTIVQTGETTLETHFVPGTVSAKCNGMETYLDLDSNGRPGRTRSG